MRSTERDHGLAIKFIGEPLAEPANERIRLILFETARELLLNVVQHSFSKTAKVEVNVINQGDLEATVLGKHQALREISGH